MMRISEEGRSLIKHFEGCKLKAYCCPAGVWTIGVGHTGPDVLEGQRITEERADELLAIDLDDSERCVSGNVSVPLTQEQFDALVSLVFNIGCAAFRQSTLRQMLQDGSDVEAGDQFLRWNKSKGMVLPGLTRRREAERRLFMGLDWKG